MKRLLLIITLSGFSTFTFAQGQMLWNNTSSTLIYVDGGPMPVLTSPVTTYYFGLFIAAPGTPPPVWGDLADPNWQNVVAYTMNSTATAGAGRLQNPGTATVPGYPPESTVNFIVRGWQSSTGGADWPAAKPGIYRYGQSALGTLMLGGGVFPVANAFGPNPGQISGLVWMPEPSSTTLIGLGLVLLARFRRKRSN